MENLGLVLSFGSTAEGDHPQNQAQPGLQQQQRDHNQLDQGGDNNNSSSQHDHQTHEDDIDLDQFGVSELQGMVKGVTSCYPPDDDGEAGSLSLGVPPLVIPRSSGAARSSPGTTTILEEAASIVSSLTTTTTSTHHHHQGRPNEEEKEDIVFDEDDIMEDWEMLSNDSGVVSLYSTEPVLSYRDSLMHGFRPPLMEPCSASRLVLPQQQQQYQKNQSNNNHCSSSHHHYCKKIHHDFPARNSAAFITFDIAMRGWEGTSFSTTKGHLGDARTDCRADPVSNLNKFFLWKKLA